MIKFRSLMTMSAMIAEMQICQRLHIPNYKFFYLSSLISFFAIFLLCSTFNNAIGTSSAGGENLSSIGNHTSTIRNTTGTINISAVIDTRNLPSNVSYFGPRDIPENVLYPEVHEREKQEAPNQILSKRGQSIDLPDEMFVNSSAVPQINEFNRTSIEGNKSLLSSTLSLAFDSFNENTSKCGGCSPPDVNVAAGPQSDVFVIVNKAGSIGKHPNCNPLCSGGLEFDIRTFFNLSAGSTDDIQDPRVLYDTLSKRWFVSASVITNNSIKLAVSKSDIPFGEWTIYNIPFTNCVDQPKIGYNNDILIITGDLVTNHCRGGNYIGIQYVLVDKNDLLASAASPRSKSSTIGATSGFYLSSLYPLQITTIDSPLIVPAVFRQHDIDRSSFIWAYIFTGKLTDPNFTGYPVLAYAPIQTVNLPPEAAQPGTNLMLDTTDFRIEDAAISQGNIWVGFNDACIPENDNMKRSCIRLLQFSITSPSPNNFTINVIKDFAVRTPGQNLFYPSLEITPNGTMGMVFGVSGSDVYPGLMFGAKFPNDPSNALTVQSPVKIGSASYTNPTQGTALICPDMTCRYGDYFGSALDPVNPELIWVAGEYIKFRNGYSTHVAKIWPGR